MASTLSILSETPENPRPAAINDVIPKGLDMTESVTSHTGGIRRLDHIPSHPKGVDGVGREQVGAGRCVPHDLLNEPVRPGGIGVNPVQWPRADGCRRAEKASRQPGDGG